MDNACIKKELEDKGYVVIPDVLTPKEVREAKSLHDKWRRTIPNHDAIHNSVDPHGIYKFHEAGQQRHSSTAQRPRLDNVSNALRTFFGHQVFDKQANDETTKRRHRHNLPRG